MKDISFWEMITSSNTSICIPRIQRDYAQGRVGKELLRQRLLMSCKKALDENKNKLLLDFVYGSKEDNDKYYPLDGQQRLTTLWLLHWYVAFNAKELDGATRNYFSKFSYETRRSSSDFCKFLCQLEYPVETLSSKDMRTYILSQTKFSAKWMLDPTVSAMLNTLCGTNITDDEDNDIVDGLAEIFKDCKEGDFKKYFDRLKSRDCPIRFYNLDMRGENLPLSDDLYIKMNARGKPLTDWENFKADLLDFVDNKDLGAEIDGCWTDLFWFNQYAGKIDAILFAFVNRYIFNEYLVCVGREKHDPQQHSLYKLYGKDGNDTAFKYEDFSLYSSDEICQNTMRNAMNNLSKVMQKLHGLSKDKLDSLCENVKASWSEKVQFDFIPKYTFDNPQSVGISNITHGQRLVFLAVCRYLEKVETIDEEKMKDWIRFAWKIADYIRKDAMSNAFNLIDEKSAFCNDIIEHLSGLEPSVIGDKSFASEQIKEEIEKAKYIIANPTMKENVIKAENFSDLHGRIAFLFHDETGKLDWDNFEHKYNRLETLFSSPKSDELKQSNILKIFLSYCTQKLQIESWSNNYSYIYDYSWESWKANFQNPKYMTPTHMFLMNEDGKIKQDAIKLFETYSEPENIYTKIYKWMLETDVLENVADRLKSGRQRPYLRRYGEKLCIYPSAEGINMEREDRDKLLQLLCNQNKINLDKNDIFSNIEGVRLFLKGWGINFTYEGYKFYWSWNDMLYINNVEYQKIESVDIDSFIELLDSAIGG